MSLVPDLSFVLVAFSDPVTVWEVTDTQTVNDYGRIVEAARADRTILAHCFDTPGDVLMSEAIGRQGGRVITVRTTEDLEVGTQSTAAENGGDSEIIGGAIVEFDGDRFVLFRITSHVVTGGRVRFEYLAKSTYAGVESP